VCDQKMSQRDREGQDLVSRVNFVARLLKKDESGFGGGQIEGWRP